MSTLANPTFEAGDVQAAHGARVEVLRCSQTAILGEVVQARVQLRAGDRKRFIMLAAGPYRYPYAAALHLARELQLVDTEAEFSDDVQLSRPLLANALRPLVRGDVVLGIPRLDTLDGESVDLLSSLVCMANLCARAGVETGFRMVVGLTADAPTAAMRSLLQRPGVRHEDVATENRATFLQPTRSQRRLLALLDAAPHPLALDTVRDVMSADAQRTEADIQALGATVLCFNGWIGRGTAFEMLAPGESERNDVRSAVVQSVALAPIEARLAVIGNGDSELATRRAYVALRRGEPEIAARLFRQAQAKPRLSPAADDLAYAVALAESGRTEGAGALFRSLEPLQLDAESLFFYGLLAARLHDARVLPYREADQAMRRAERESRGRDADCTLRMRIERARIMLERKQAAKALTLLRRVVRSVLEEVPLQTRLEYEIVLARAYAATGNARHAERELMELRARAVCPVQRLNIERVLMEVMEVADPRRAEAHRRALSVALATFDCEAVERMIPSVVPPWVVQLLCEELPGKDGEVELPPPATGADPTELFAWLSRRGATSMAWWDGSAIGMAPLSALEDQDLVDWYKLAIENMRKFDGVWFEGRQDLPYASPDAGDVILRVPRWGRVGPLIIQFRREELRQPEIVLGMFKRH